MPGTSSTGPIKDAPLPVAPVVDQFAPVLTRAAPVIHQAVKVIDSASGVVPVPVQLPDTSGKIVTPSARPAAAPATHAREAMPQPASAGLAPKTTVPGPGPTQIRVYASALGALSAVAGYFARYSDAEFTLDAELLLWLSAPQGSSGSSSSSISGSGGGQAAGDAAGIWKSWDARSIPQAPDLAQAPATSPSFDPGSSPD